MRIKVSLIIILITCLGLSCHPNAKTEDNVAHMGTGIESRDSITKFIGKEIRVFLEDSQFSKYKALTVMTSKPGKASSLAVVYDDQYYMEIFPDRFTYMEPFSTTANWDLEKFKMEKIWRIDVYKNGTLIKSYE